MKKIPKNTIHNCTRDIPTQVRFSGVEPAPPLPPPTFSGMDMFHEVSEDAPFLPPYSVHRFPLWSFL